RPATPIQAAVLAAHTLVFLSTDGGAYGGLGAVRFATRPPIPNPIVAVIDLDEFAGDGSRTPAAALVATAAHRMLETVGVWPQHPGFLGQLVDLGFPFTLYEQGPFIARGIP